jgi:hypothetical protein
MPCYRFFETDRKFKNSFAHIAVMGPSAKEVLKRFIVTEIKPVDVLAIYRIGYVVEESTEQGCPFKKWLFCRVH